MTKLKKNKALDIEKFIFYWNERFPIDKWYREKYGIAFGSEEHKRLNQINMSIDFKEQLIYKNKEKKEQEQKDSDFFNSGLPTELTGGVETKKIVKMSKKEIDHEFENFDFSQFNDPIKPE